MIRRTLLAGLGAFVVATIIAGVTMFLLRGGARSAETSMGPCAEDSTYRCIPHLKAEDLVAALKKRGFECYKPGGARGCELEIGETRLSVGVGTHEGGISRLTATMGMRADEEPSEGTMALLRWVAGVPFAHDPQGAGEVDAWLTRQVAERKNVRATIAGYSYQLDSQPGGSGRRTLRLDIGESLEW
ncbi:hypothetical protein AB0J80_04880 [Actinoplanes sp. NPDC049548]|uniref:hypothetical protein n=1 Tax=Actinoplanes sp. NPDC049548 TaxID=3155152 RepID=UPI003448D761